ncbi:unnamed protein product [Cyprideis torosa]|uniref:Uncharacterized protein n=1 Tax=Cyprideis torosa TaxID=163714 RepID=A0A7R8ZLJ6_9CRUS|nr:unnamed protein product [Cyprideis torosa]CAG0893346.1 unnamed protein product [Cyprideis torosa]
MVRRWTYWPLQLVFLAWFVVNDVFGFEGQHEKCQNIRIPYCSNLPYNSTRMPNFLQHADQELAAMKMESIRPLVTSECSPHLKFFTCSVFVPLCTSQTELPIPACRSVCEMVRDACRQKFAESLLHWPDFLDCRRFPTPESGICMDLPSRESEPVPAPTEIPDGRDLRAQQKWEEILRASASLAVLPLSPDCPQGYQWLRGRSICTPLCRQTLVFSEYQKSFAVTWMSILAILSFAAATFTFFTFILDMSRFPFPERPVVWIALCFSLQSFAYLIRVFLGNPPACQTSRSYPEPYLLYDGMISSTCTAVFLFQYFFGTAAFTWWVLLSVSNFLSAGRRWSSEEFRVRSSHLHGVGWGFPGSLTALALILRQIDGNELTGMCSIGNQRSQPLLWFIVIPLALLLFVGASFAVATFLSLRRIHSRLLRNGRPTEQLQKLMLRSGAFSGLFTVIMIVLLASHLLNMAYLDQWRIQDLDMARQCSSEDCRVPSSTMRFVTGLLTISFNMLGGIISGLWACSQKSLALWISTLFCCWRRQKQRPAPTWFNPPPPVLTQDEPVVDVATTDARNDSNERFIITHHVV